MEEVHPVGEVCQSNEIRTWWNVEKRIYVAFLGTYFVCSRVNLVEGSVLFGRLYVD